MSTTVSAELRLQFFASPQVTVPLPGKLCYFREDPYAIRLMIGVGLIETVEWHFARDLLTRGIVDHTGIGDVRVWPSADPGDGEPGSVLNIEIFSPDGQAHLAMSAMEISDFLRRTYRIVPRGEESRYIDVSAELDDLFRQALRPHNRRKQCRSGSG